MIKGGIGREEGKNANDILRSIRFSKKEVMFHAANYYKWQRRDVMDTYLKDMSKKKKEFLNL